MKKTLTTLLIILSLGLNAQNLIIDGNTVLGQNCGQGQQQTLTYQDVNFNGNFTLTLKNVKLIINGNLNGTGTIENFCNNNQSSYCLSGNMNGNITFDGVADCNTLSTPVFNTVVNQDLPFKIFDLNERLLMIGKTHPNMYESLQVGVYVVIVDGYEPFKIIKQN